jgi:hypothetical protein
MINRHQNQDLSSESMLALTANPTNRQSKNPAMILRFHRQSLKNRTRRFL